MSGRIVVGVSGGGTNLRALGAAASRGELGGEIVLVFADRDCPALAWAEEQGIETALVPGGTDDILAETLAAVTPDVIVLAGYMRILGPATLALAPDRIVNTHPSLLPSFPGAHAVRDALAHGVAVTGCTVHLVNAELDGGPILAQEAVPVLPGDDEATLHDRIRDVEHRLLPRAVALLVSGAVSSPDGRHVHVDLALAEERLPVARRALLSVSDKAGLAEFVAYLADRCSDVRLLCDDLDQPRFAASTREHLGLDRGAFELESRQVLVFVDHHATRYGDAVRGENFLAVRFDQFHVLVP